MELLPITFLPRHKVAYLLSVAFSICLLNRLHVPYLCPAQDAASLTNDSSSSKPKPLASQLVIFVGGCPRSGTTLTRAMLDAHPDIRCGQETHILPRIFGLYDQMVQTSQLERHGAKSPGEPDPDEALYRATRAFAAKIIAGHGDPAKYLCNKDPLLLQYMKHLAKMFPKSKYVLMIRDGRAVTHSIVSRNVTIGGVDITSHLVTARFWCSTTKAMMSDCSQLHERCMTVFYEKLVTDPSTQMKEVLRFLDIPWHNDVLRHHELVGSEVSLSE